MNYIVHTLTLILFCYSMYLQIHNLFKYKNYNGVLKARLTILGILVCLTVHTIRFFSNAETMAFMFVSSILFVFLYHGFDYLFSNDKSKIK